MAYIGSAEDARRIRKQEEERERQKKDFEERKKLGESNVDGAGLRQFGAGTAEVLEAAFKSETVGLVTREEFLNKRNTLKDRLEEEKEKKRIEAELEAAERRAERKRKKQRTEAKAKLSFVEDGQDEEEDKDKAALEDLKELGAQKGTAHVRLGKNPNAETTFLPDQDRENREAELKKQIEEEYEIREQAMKNEPLEITYSYFDGSGHRKVITAKRGDSVGEFLKSVRDQLSPDFKELRNTSLSNMLFVKEDIILPHSVTFHELIKKRVRGKTGPLFDFGVHEDVRAYSDSRIQERTDAHAGKVVTRHFYERNKHIFPASKWEQLPEEF